MNSELEHAVGLMSSYAAPWAIAGGWAIDLFLGVETRPHSDVDIAVLRRDQHILAGLLADARLVKMVNHEPVRWRAGETLIAPIHEVHASWPDGRQLEFLMNDADAAQWVYRRDPSLRLPLEVAFNADADIPFLAPEVVLLYKSKQPTPKDVADFEAVRARLSTGGRAWLASALRCARPNHPWADIL